MFVLHVIKNKFCRQVVLPNVNMKIINAFKFQFLLKPKLRQNNIIKTTQLLV